MELDYKRNIEYIRDKLRISASEIFDFIDLPCNDDYNQIFRFYQEAIELNSYYGISPGYIYFRNDNRFNAKAIKRDKHYIIEINKGLIELFDRRFKSYFDLNNFDDLGQYKTIEDRLSNSIGELMFQTTTHFTFYHELGHLIQFVDKSDAELNETLNSNSSNINQSHSEELDADLFSSICVSTHFYQYFEKYKGDFNENDVTNYISILTSSIFVYFLSFDDYSKGFYLKSESHPHPLVRILSAIARIIDYFEYMLKVKGLVFKINQQVVFKETFRVSEIITNKMISDAEFQGFLKLMSDNLVSIKKHYDELILIIQSNPNSAINRRNEIIKKHST